MQSYITEGIGNGSWHEEGHDYGYNYVGFTAWADDLNPPLYVHVTGRTVSASSFKRQVSADSAGTDVLQAAGIPLITKDNANEVAARLQQYGHMHTKIKAKIQMAPTMSCGDCVSIPTRFGSVVGCITRMDIDLTGGLLATVEVLA